MRNKLFIALFAIAVIPVLCLGFFLYQRAEEYIKIDKLNYLNTVADNKLTLIENLVSDLKHDLTILQSAYTIRNSLPLVSKYINDRTNPQYIKGESILSSGVLNAYLQRIYVKEVFLMDTEGMIVYKTNVKDNGTHLGKTPNIFSENNLAKWRKDIWISDIIDCGACKEIYIVAPAFESDHSIIGFISFKVDMSVFYDLTIDRKGLGQTGEMAIGKIEDNNIIYLTPLLYKTGKDLPFKVSLDEEKAKNLPLAQALKGGDGSGLTEDYRGVSVIAAWRQIPSMKWAFAVKIDQREAFADIYTFRNFVIILIVLILLVSLLVSQWISKSISVPVVALNKATKIISSGNFDCKIDINSKGEIGELANSFDQMVSKLKDITVSRDILNIEVLERKKSEAIVSSLLNEKEFLLTEVHHRIKNNMAAVIGILDLHADTLHESDAHAILAINDASSRLRSMCVLYDKLYRSQNLIMISIKTYLESLTEQLLCNFSNSDHVTVRKAIEDFTITAKLSFALGIIVNEILTNTMKYAFEGIEKGSITISAFKQMEKAVIVIQDDGVGIPEDFDIAKSTGFGMSLIKMLTAQIGGTIKMQHDNGTKTTIIFPV